MTFLKKNKSNPLIRLAKNQSEQSFLIISATFCSILNKLFDLAPPVLIGLSIDVVVREKSSWLASYGFESVPTQLLILATASFLIWTAESFFEYLYGLLWRNLAQSTQHNLRIQAYNHLQKLELSFFESDSTGRLLAILNDDINQLERFLDQGANQLLQLFVTVILVGGAMAFLAPGVAIFAFIPIPIILWGSIRFQKRLAPKYKDVREKAGDIAARLSNNLGGMLTIKSFATESWELDRLRLNSHSYQRSNRNAIRLSAAFIPLIRFAILFAFLAILIVGGLQAWEGELEIGIYSFLVFITQRLLWPLTTLGHVLDEYQRSMASTNRVLDLIDKPIEISGGSLRLEPKNVIGNIEFKNVYFNYKNRNNLLTNFNLNISAGTTVGIVGSTGSGKSSLVKLILRLYPIKSGEIKLDGIGIDKYNLLDLRRSIALVSQEVYLFHGTIEENISYGNNSASQKQIHEAAILSEAADFIEKLPEGYQTLVGERGQKLSGGQCQRIALARAILKDAPILILDEATASVDNETEAAIQRSLSKVTSNRTTIVIAHRLSTIKNADKIVVLQEGSISEVGTHEFLIKNQGVYFDLWKVQAGAN
ncbi:MULTISPECIES: ABC transporter ATP-binding protein [Prochlorococcus]|uniref:ABC-type multidrug transport system ATPase and permease components n=1 Tax=Prochlorococcus marinus (strain SARG / CCMP1375 / SS120) TaxID=167539 RepID=Q7VBJ6_PROMA|nr:MULTISPECIES: ABC transporter ATP-binding protein [Prochlorococcus]AAQ00141.1 ABC-type multidrug transport system ATPase and permease components [Prochlorococcus marinus subsp. marinus str. CCMP1375]KGG13937.1 ABC transporter [Prochlorococcus marinus str. LG]KGG19070.1 ABC transporter [Prochlorococcus marinus str. SS2]KGG23390.1 ABC transporter [Prochlorococcus marinus str. SS35]KGG32374.1 ABC transporter [Prochlorococcus marinus str. SS51]